MASTPKMIVELELGAVPAWVELLHAAALVVQVTPRSESVDRLQVAVAAIMLGTWYDGKAKPEDEVS